MKALKSTIAEDGLVLRWFLYLLEQKGAKKDMVKFKHLYSRLTAMLFLKNVCSAALIGVLTYCFLASRYRLLVVAAALLVCYVASHQAVRGLGASLGVEIMKKNFKPEELSALTLYQIGECLAGRYQIKSLVLSMTAADILVRRALIFAVVFATCIFPLNFISWCGLIIAVYWAAGAVINMPFIYNRLS